MQLRATPTERELKEKIRAKKKLIRCNQRYLDEELALVNRQNKNFNRL